jgi:hypothetical protein
MLCKNGLPVREVHPVRGVTVGPQLDVARPDLPLQAVPRRPAGRHHLVCLDVHVQDAEAAQDEPVLASYGSVGLHLEEEGPRESVHHVLQPERGEVRQVEYLPGDHRVGGGAVILLGGAVSIKFLLFLGVNFSLRSS